MSVTLAIVLFALHLLLFRSHLALQLALVREKLRRGEIARQEIHLSIGEATCLGRYIDDLYDWAGTISVRRISEKAYHARVIPKRYRHGPNALQGLYINGWKVPAMRPFLFHADDSVILRTGYSQDKIVRIILDSGDKKAKAA